MRMTGSVLAVILFVLLPAALNAQVLGSCGDANENEPNAALKSDETGKSVEVQQVLRPGEKAVNFSLAAVVGDEIKMVKLSDYNGKWRVVCFYPADFTFV